VMGLSEDIKILTPEFDEYIETTINRLHSNYHR
jgi:hypothetical protein